MELKDLGLQKDKFTLRYIEKVNQPGVLGKFLKKQTNTIRTSYLYRSKIKVGEIARNTELIESIITIDLSDEKGISDKAELTKMKSLFK